MAINEFPTTNQDERPDDDLDREVDEAFGSWRDGHEAPPGPDLALPAFQAPDPPETPGRDFDPPQPGPDVEDPGHAPDPRPQSEFADFVTPVLPFFAFAPLGTPGEQQEILGPQTDEPQGLGDLQYPETTEPAGGTQTLPPELGPTPPPPDVTQPPFQEPQPAPVYMGGNEDLFARVGWPVAPPRTASTFWYF